MLKFITIKLKGILSYFIHNYGPSPESNDELKPITDYMIEKYVDCE